MFGSFSNSKDYYSLICPEQAEIEISEELP